jgi:hypothetical protein
MGNVDKCEKRWDLECLKSFSFTVAGKMAISQWALNFQTEKWWLNELPMLTESKNNTSQCFMETLWINLLLQNIPVDSEEAVIEVQIS